MCGWVKGIFGCLAGNVGTVLGSSIEDRRQLGFRQDENGRGDEKDYVLNL